MGLARYPADLPQFPASKLGKRAIGRRKDTGQLKPSIMPTVWAISSVIGR
jgi:hypothetical protein